MKLQMLLLALAGFFFCQAQKPKQNSISVSVPVIWAKTETLYFTLGNPRYSGSTTTNSGVNVNYSRKLYKAFYGMLGVGYFNQSFNIVRPVDYDDGSTNLLYHTESYSYKNIWMSLGVKYHKSFINESNVAKAGISYNYLHSYEQKYVISQANGVQQVNQLSLPLCDMFNLDLGLERYFGKIFSIELDGMFSLYTKWRNDKMFFKCEYSNDSQRAANNKSSIGLNFSTRFHF